MILEIILIIICSILILIAIILYSGLKISLKYNKIGKKLEYNLNVQILNKFSIFKKEKAPNKKESEDKDKSNNKDNIKTLWPYIKLVIEPAIDYIFIILDSVNISSVYNCLKFGSPNYADTAKYTGYMWCANTIPNSTIEGCELIVEPVFGDCVIDFEGKINIKLKLYKIIIPTIRFLLIKDVRNLIKKYREIGSGKDEGDTKEN